MRCASGIGGGGGGGVGVGGGGSGGGNDSRLYAVFESGDVYVLV